MRLAESAAVLLSAVFSVFPATLASSPPAASNASDVFATGAGGWADAFGKASGLVSRLTLEEKSSMVTGSLALNIGSYAGCIGKLGPVERVNFTGLCLQDGPLAIRLADLASVFPAGVNVASTWDRNLMRAQGVAMGKEFRGKGANVQLGPTAGPLGRYPLGGRNWEGYSPDPYLTGVAVAETIRGIQSTGVQVTVKHLIGNEQETQRSTTTVNGTTILPISANIDDRTTHELYLWPFADAIRAGVASVMCAYNRVNGTAACENDHLLNHLVKTELAFQGYVVSDFFAVYSGLPSARGGLDLNMPGSITRSGTESYWGSNITDFVRSGQLPELRLDDMIKRLLTPYFHLGQDSDFPSPDPTGLEVTAVTYGATNMIGGSNLTLPKARDVRADHADLIRQVAAEGTILLKNIDQVLPLKEPEVLGVFGSDAMGPSGGLYAGSHGSLEFGTQWTGGGSGSGRATYVVAPLEALRAHTLASDTRIQYVTNNTMCASGDFTGVYPTPDVCVVFLKAFASEGEDRTSFHADWNSSAIVNSVASYCPQTIVVLHNPGPVLLPWAHNPNVSAILLAHYPGQESGNAIADVLYGAVEPAGRLPYTIPARAEDAGAPIVRAPVDASPDGWQDDFEDGLLVDYRRFDALDVDPLYAFGFGLGYTTFDVTSNLTVSKANGTGRLSALPKPVARGAELTPGGNPDLHNPVLRASLGISNTGKRAGSTVVQLYVSLPQASTPSGTPVRVLRDFERVTLGARKKKEITFELTRRDVSYWNVVTQDWEIPTGEIGFEVGFSIKDLRGRAEVTLVE